MAGVGLQLPSGLRNLQEARRRQEVLAVQIAWLRDQWKRFLFGDALRWDKQANKSVPRAWLRNTPELERDVRRAYRAWHLFFRDVDLSDPETLSDIDHATYWKRVAEYEAVRARVNVLQVAAGADPTAEGADTLEATRTPPPGTAPTSDFASLMWPVVAGVALGVWLTSRRRGS